MIGMEEITMTLLRRYDYHDRLCFVTCVTFNRRRILLNRPNLFIESWKSSRPIAWIVMPEHFHAIIPVGAESLSSIMHRFKVTYAWRFNEVVSTGRIWQPRFWDHWIRDENDLAKHLDYIHANPVHHGHVKDPFLWQQSSLMKWHMEGYYSRDWGGVGDSPEDQCFGE
jgi:putative transposase